MKRRVRLLTLGASLCLAGASAQAQQSRPQTVMVDGFRIQAQTGGLQHANTGVPTIVLESGGGAPSAIWARVFDKVAAFAPVVAWDRPGNSNGMSQRDGQLPTPRHIAGRLHALLAQLGLKPPYVLVGHSWGGPLIRMFTAVYPSEVAGLVYVDPTDLRTTERGRAYLFAQGYTAEQLAEQRRKSEETARAEPAKAPDQTDGSVTQALVDSDYAEFHALPPIPDVPVSVLMSAKFDPRLWPGRPCEPLACHDVWVRFRTDWLRDFTRGSSNSTFTITTASGHQIHHEDSDLVVWAIQRVIAAATRR